MITNSAVIWKYCGVKIIQPDDEVSLVASLQAFTSVWRDTENQQMCRGTPVIKSIMYASRNKCSCAVRHVMIYRIQGQYFLYARDQQWWKSMSAAYRKKTTMKSGWVKMISCFWVWYNWRRWTIWQPKAQERKMYWFASTFSYKLTKIFQTHNHRISEWLRYVPDSSWFIIWHFHCTMSIVWDWACI